MRTPRVEVSNVLDCDIKVSSNLHHAITFSFGLVPLGNVGISLSSILQWVELYQNCPFYNDGFGIK